jgi:hypothetical protein
MQMEGTSGAPLMLFAEAGFTRTATRRAPLFQIVIPVLGLLGGIDLRLVHKESERAARYFSDSPAHIRTGRER